MNLAKQFREFGVLNSINPLPPDAQVIWYNLMQCFNTARWNERKLVVRTQTLENLCGMTRKRLAVSRNTLIQRGLIQYYPSKQASGSPSYELMVLYDEQDGNNSSVFPTETQGGTHRGTQGGTQGGTQNGTQKEHLLKTKPNEEERAPPVLDFSENVTSDIESDLLKNQILFEGICIGARRSPEISKVALTKYHLWLEENQKYPSSRKALTAGFKRWLMNEKNQPSPEQTDNSATKTATEERSQRLLDEIG